MRSLVVLAALFPVVATAQVNLTATPASARFVVTELQDHVRPGGDAADGPVGWCLADAYRLVADEADNRVARALGRAAGRYESHGTRRASTRPGGLPLVRGAVVWVRVTDRAMCATRVRTPVLFKG